MNIIKNNIKVLIILYINLFLFTGCHTFYEIDADELEEINKNDVVKIIYTNGDTTTINYIKEITYLENHDIKIVYYYNDITKLDSTIIPSSLDGIRNVEIEKINYPLSVLASILFTSSFLLFLLIILQSNGAFAT